MEDRVIHSRGTKADDLEVHVSTVRTERGEYIDIREFVPSLEQYGRGVLLPKAIAKAVGDGIRQAVKK